MTFLNLLTTVAPILLIVGATLILEDDPTSVELGFLLGILLIYGVLIRVSRFIRQFDSEVLVASPEIEHQKDVLNISTFPGLRRLRVFQIIDSLNRSGDRWYNTFSKALPLLVFNVYAAVIILALLSCWLSIFTPRLRIFLILFALFLFHSLIATFLLVSHESNTLLISHLDRVKLVARRLLWGLLAILVISIGARIGAQPLYTILFGIVFWLYGYYLTGELTRLSSS